jgi:murein DD-endopeptidase MepM/ murein hydrolase activator NlpD
MKVCKEKKRYGVIKVNIRKKWVPVLIALGMFVGLNALSVAAEVDIQRQIDQKNRELSRIKNKERSVMGNLLKTQKEVDKISSDLSKLKNRVGTTEKRMQSINAELNRTQVDIQKVRGNIDSRKEQLNTRLVSIYKYGYQSYLEILFQVKNFGEFISRFEMVGNFVRSDLEMLKNLQQQHEYISQKKQEISKYQDELERQKRVYDRLKAEAQTQHGRLLSKANTQRRALSNIQNDRQQLEQALDELEELSRSMEAEIRNEQNKNRTALGTGTYIWPVRGRISSQFGYRFHPVLKKNKYHSGIDIASPRGTPILAADSGIVIFSGYNGGYGKMLTIDHGIGYSTVYGHASALLVGYGQKVTKGQKIALVGSTGLSTGPHLHFEVRKNGVPQNPLSYL